MEEAEAENGFDDYVKKRYLGKHINKLTEEGSHRLPYRAVKYLKTTDKPKQWDIRNLRPGLNDVDICRLVRNENAVRDVRVREKYKIC